MQPNLPEPSNGAAEHLMDHEYDGIREYDNPTPGWWTGIFALSVLLCAPYVVMYHFGDWGWDVHQSLTREVAADLRRQFGEIGDLKADQATLIRFMADPKWLPVGEVVYRTNCVQCHGPDGAGQVGGGVNLTDEYYKNVRSLPDLARVISEGAGNGAMPAWKTRLHPNEVVLAACYVANLRGRNLPGRPREGDAIAAWPPPSAGGPASRPAGQEPGR